MELTGTPAAAAAAAVGMAQALAAALNKIGSVAIQSLVEGSWGLLEIAAAVVAVRVKGTHCNGGVGAVMR